MPLPEIYCLHILSLQVDSVITKMGLWSVADSRVGGSVNRGISGGEKRRVTIALQLLQDPGGKVTFTMHLGQGGRSYIYRVSS